MHEEDLDDEGYVDTPLSPEKMSGELARILVTKGAIRKETEIDARYRGADLSGARTANSLGTFIVVSAKVIKDEIVFEGLDTRDGHKQAIKSDDIIRIDGMDPIRFANIFGLTETGEPMKVGKRRGRKPKVKPL